MRTMPPFDVDVEEGIFKKPKLNANIHSDHVLLCSNTIGKHTNVNDNNTSGDDGTSQTGSHEHSKLSYEQSQCESKDDQRSSAAEKMHHQSVDEITSNESDTNDDDDDDDVDDDDDDDDESCDSNSSASASAATAPVSTAGYYTLHSPDTIIELCLKVINQDILMNYDTLHLWVAKLAYVLHASLPHQALRPLVQRLSELDRPGYTVNYVSSQTAWAQSIAQSGGTQHPTQIPPFFYSVNSYGVHGGLPVPQDNSDYIPADTVPDSILTSADESVRGAPTDTAPPGALSSS